MPENTDLWAAPVAPLLGEDGRCRLSPFCKGAIIGACLLIPPYVLLFVWGRDPKSANSWGWCLEAVLMGVAFGGLIGSLIGGIFGSVVGLVVAITSARNLRINQIGRSG